MWQACLIYILGRSGPIHFTKEDCTFGKWAMPRWYFQKHESDTVLTSCAINKRARKGLLGTRVGPPYDPFKWTTEQGAQVFDILLNGLYGWIECALFLARIDQMVRMMLPYTRVGSTGPIPAWGFRWAPQGEDECECSGEGDPLINGPSVD